MYLIMLLLTLLPSQRKPACHLRGNNIDQHECVFQWRFKGSGFIKFNLRAGECVDSVPSSGSPTR